MPASLAILALFAPVQVLAQEIVPPYSSEYLVDILPTPPGVAVSYGGMAFIPGNPDLLLVGGDANGPEGALYAIHVIRGSGDHVVGFAGSASMHIDAPYVNGGVTFHPSGVLFLARYPVSEIGQVRVGSSLTDKIVSLAPFGVIGSPGGLAFVPYGFPGFNELKMITYSGGEWYTVHLAPDGAGLLDVTDVTLDGFVEGGSDAFAYVPPRSPLFVDYRSILVTNWNHGSVVAYELDDDGNPLWYTRSLFLSGLRGAEGIVADPVTGDFLVSTAGLGFGYGNKIVVIRGFSGPIGIENLSWAEVKSLYR
jgi:hypothetical protein